MSFWGELYRNTEPRNPAVTKHEARCVWEALAGLSPILDVGCGDGAHVRLLRDRFFDVFGVDLVEPLPGVDGLDVGDMRDLPYPDESFAGAYSLRNTALGFSEGDLPVVWNEMARVLRPGGRLFVTATDAEWAARYCLEPITATIGAAEEVSYFHAGRLWLSRRLGALRGGLSVRLFTADEWPGFLESVGFELVKYEACMATAHITARRTLTRVAS